MKNLNLKTQINIKFWLVLFAITLSVNSTLANSLNTGGTTSTVNKTTFSNTDYGAIVAPSVNPFTGTNPIGQPTIYIDFQCNKFTNNLYGISGSGKLMDQGTIPKGASNDFNITDNPNLRWAVIWSGLYGGTGNFTYSSKDPKFSPTLTSFIPPNPRPPVLLDGSSVSTPNYSTFTANGDKCPLGTWWTYSVRKEKDKGLIGTTNHNQKHLSLFPVPIQEQLTLKPINTLNINTPYSVTIYDLQGKVLYKTNNKIGDITINTENWVQGLYIVEYKKQQLLERYMILK